ncbi:TMC3 [Branchiostoma lanceolatum]|uniref:TMC3 protein n=1 Tax=Branchiostoma lanceolatum TaxID=7740 RepID=A0A8K0EZ65_BRALA|nr:TMC3 [Branchiostoma lanceolatum]
MASAPSIAPREDSSGGYDVESLHSLGSEYQSTHTNFSQDCDEAIYREWGLRPKGYDSDQGTPQAKRRADQGTPQGKRRADQGTPQGKRRADQGTPQGKRRADQGTPLSKRRAEQGTPQGKQRADQGSRRGQLKSQTNVASIESFEETKIEVVEEQGGPARMWRSAAGRVMQEGRRRSRLDRRRVRRMSRVEEGVLKKLLPKDEESDWCVRRYQLEDGAEVHSIDLFVVGGNVVMPVLVPLNVNVRSLDHRPARMSHISIRKCQRENLDYLRRNFSCKDRDSDDVLKPGASDEEATEEEILENIQRQKEIIEAIRKQPWRMKKKLKTLKVAQDYLEKYEGKLSKSRGYQEATERVWKKIRRELANFASFFIPWDTRIKTIESYFGSVVASYFIFLRWLFWINIALSILMLSFVVLPELLVGLPYGSLPRKAVPEPEMHRAENIATIWDFGGYMKFSVLFYGYYSNRKSIGSGYQLPLAYFLTGIGIFVYSFAVILRKMAKNSRMAKLSTEDDQFTFCWKVFCGWDYLIGQSDTADNKFAAISTGIREAILEEEEKNKDERSMKEKCLILILRILANFMIVILLAGSGYAIQLVVERSEQFEKMDQALLNWWEQNEVSMVVSIITMVFPVFFDLIGQMEKYHPRVMLQWQLARIMVLNLGNLYTLMIALFKKVNNLAEEARKARVALDTLHQVSENASWALQNVTASGMIQEILQLDEHMLASANDTQVVEALTRLAGIKEQCWETIVGQEMYKLSVFDMVATLVTTIIVDFLRGLFVRFANYCWCWDLEAKIPGYGEFGVAENVLHLIYNQGMIWMGAFFAPCLPVLNVLKLVALMYFRSWAVIMCNTPHQRVFRASRSNNFYFVLLLIMLFLSMLPTGYVMVSIEPSRNCGPFSGRRRMFDIISDTVKEQFPAWLTTVLSYMSTAGVILPVFMLLVMAIYYLESLVRSYKEANNDLRIQLQYVPSREAVRQPVRRCDPDPPPPADGTVPAPPAVPPGAVHPPAGHQARGRPHGPHGGQGPPAAPTAAPTTAPTTAAWRVRPAKTNDDRKTFRSRSGLHSRSRGLSAGTGPCGRWGRGPLLPGDLLCRRGL